MNNEKWRTWKQLHNISSMSWNILLSQILATYFAKCLTNEGKLKHAYEFQEKFPEVLRNFLRLKTQFWVSGGLAKFRVLNNTTMEYGVPWPCSSNKRMFLVVMDLRDTLGHSVAKDYKKQPHFASLLATLRGLRTPSVSKPTIWLWIVNLANWLAQAKEYAT